MVLLLQPGVSLGILEILYLVLPLQSAVAATFTSAQEPVESRTPKLSNFAGVGFQAFEDQVSGKLQKV